MRVLVLSLLLVASAARADDLPPIPDDTLARGHFTRGAAAYEAGRYEEALQEFEAAHLARPLPAFDFNIAKCLDRLDRKSEAVAAYGKFLRSNPSGNMAEEARTRVEKLEHAIRDAEGPPVAVTEPAATQAPSQIVFSATLPPRPAPKRYLVPGILAGSALALAAVGAGLLGSAASSFNSLESSCAPSCAPSSWAGLPARAYAGEALLGVAGAVAVVDIVLFIRAAKRGK